MSLLDNTVALITGAARGIGRAIADEFAREGANLVIFDRAFPEDFEAAAAEWRALGRTVIARQVDITDAANVEKNVEETIAECGRIDILVNNAGITRDKLLMRMADEDWDMVMTVNLKGSFLMTRAVSKAMMRQRAGKIINISSVVGVMGNAGQSNYSASKAGLIGFTKSIAKELAGRNITVNAIAPGYIETEMTAVLSEEQRAAFMGVIPLKRGGTPADVARAAAFLASKNSDYITGQVLCVDGGMIM
ncbi:MAG: 3-oxoacyl-[acyl-carrier-protein] reductase [Ignavibacteria bacterium]|nr:3-oxoacyl-[acyl-carrier-protein] reductase [Ignavibacteria bacterium]